MRTDIPALDYPTTQSRAGVTVTLYQSGTPRDLIIGTEGLTTIDLSPFATRISHTSSEASIALRWTNELAGANRPKAGQLVRLAVGPHAVFTGHIDAIGAERESRGQREMTLTVRRRDAVAWWRDLRRVSDVYSVGVDLSAIAVDVAEALGLATEEYDLPTLGISLAHDSAQLADLNAWDMLEMISQPGLKEPLVDGRGVLKWLDRNVRREPSVVIPLEQIESIENGSARPPLTIFRVKWLDPTLMRVDGQEKVLTRAPLTITVGFFNPRTTIDVWYSEDHQQRADLCRLHVLQNPTTSFWGSSCSHSFAATSEYGGRLAVQMDDLISMAELIADIAVVVAAIVAKGVPFIGTVLGAAEAIAITDALRTLTQQAVGAYEVVGVPYDMIHAVNESEAYDQSAPDWAQQYQEVHNDLVPNEAVADALAVNELVYRARAASRASLSIADDLRLEKGDLVELEDGRRFYADDLSRDLTRGAPAILKLSGFFV